MSEPKIKINKTFGYHLRMMRLQEGFGVSELAKLFQLMGCDITREFIVKVENGKHHLTIEQLKAYKEALNTTYDEIFDYEEEE